jgi:E3 SUMO-protein ligase PIAS1
VQEILDTVPRSTDQVTIKPDGQWSTEDNQHSRSNGHDNDDYDSDDLVEVPDYRVTAIKNEAVPTPISLARTPPLSSREASSAPRTGNKRTSEVIDLTLSDDDEPPRPPKKVAYTAPSSNLNPSRRPGLPSFGSSSVPHRPHSQSHTSMSSLPRYTLPPIDPHRYPDASSHGRNILPPPSQSYQGHGTSSYSTYLDSSP